MTVATPSDTSPHRRFASVGGDLAADDVSLDDIEQIGGLLDGLAPVAAHADLVVGLPCRRGEPAEVVVLPGPADLALVGRRAPAHWRLAAVIVMPQRGARPDTPLAVVCAVQPSGSVDHRPCPPGSSASTVLRAGSDAPMSAAPSLLSDSVCRFARRATAPSAQGPSALAGLLWVHRVASAAFAHSSPWSIGWTDVARLHPMADPGGHCPLLGSLERASLALDQGDGWRLLTDAVQQIVPCPIPDPAWFDEGSQDRWCRTWVAEPDDLLADIDDLCHRSVGALVRLGLGQARRRSENVGPAGPDGSERCVKPRIQWHPGVSE